jgi:hypothetical protein
VRVGHLNVTRKEFYDRQPNLVTLQSFTQNVGAHPTTVQWSYTVPSGSLAFCGFLTVKTWVRVPAGAGIESFAYISLNNFIASASILRASVFDTANYVQDEHTVSPGIAWVPGSFFIAGDYQGAVGPTSDYLESAQFSEFTQLG